jgi:hypothetical protein
MALADELQAIDLGAWVKSGLLFVQYHPNWWYHPWIPGATVKRENSGRMQSSKF